MIVTKYQTKVIEFESYDGLSKYAAELLSEQIKRKPDSVLGLSTGSTPIGMYEELINLYRDSKINFDQVKTFNLDEYMGLAENNKNSYRYFMKNIFFKFVNIPEESCFIPNGNAADIKGEIINYENEIDLSGGIDLQVLGLGENGHIGFNEPGTQFDQDTHLIKLAEHTRKANSRYFDSIEDVPEYAITMGINTIMKSRKILLLISGENKKEAFHRFMTEQVNPNFPASILRLHSDVTVLITKDALD